MKSGDKVICVNAGPNPRDPQFKSPLISGAIYVVRDLVKTPGGEIGIQLIGISPPEPWRILHDSFSPSRFRLLAEMKNAAKQRMTKRFVLLCESQNLNPL